MGLGVREGQRHGMCVCVCACVCVCVCLMDVCVCAQYIEERHYFAHQRAGARVRVPWKKLPDCTCPETNGR